jgi:hypothetical protein
MSMVAILTIFCLIGPMTRTASSQVLDSGISRQQLEDRSYLSYTTEALDNLLTFGTDTYGTPHPELLVSVLDVRTKQVVTPDFGDSNWRADTR